MFRILKFHSSSKLKMQFFNVFDYQVIKKKSITRFIHRLGQHSIISSRRLIECSDRFWLCMAKTSAVTEVHTSARATWKTRLHSARKHLQGPKSFRENALYYLVVVYYPSHSLLSQPHITLAITYYLILKLKTEKN